MILQEQILQLKHRRSRAKKRFAFCVIILLITCAFGVWEVDPYSHTTVPSLLTPAPPRSATPRRTPFLLLENKQSGEFSAISYYEYTGDPDHLDQAWVSDHRESAGFLLPWQYIRVLKMSISSASQRPRSAAELQAIRNAVADALSIDRQFYGPRIINNFRQSDSKTRSIDPFYLLIDIAAIIALVLTPISGIKFVKAHREAKQILMLANQCPKCRYDLTGIEHQATNCPECGQTLNF